MKFSPNIALIDFIIGIGCTSGLAWLRCRPNSITRTVRRRLKAARAPVLNCLASRATSAHTTSPRVGFSPLSFLESQLRARTLHHHPPHQLSMLPCPAKLAAASNSSTLLHSSKRCSPLWLLRHSSASSDRRSGRPSPGDHLPPDPHHPSWTPTRFAVFSRARPSCVSSTSTRRPRPHRHPLRQQRASTYLQCDHLDWQPSAATGHSVLRRWRRCSVNCTSKRRLTSGLDLTLFVPWWSKEQSPSRGRKNVLLSHCYSSSLVFLQVAELFDLSPPPSPLAPLF